MLATIGNKKIKILFYILVFIFLSTISFFERTNIFDNTIFFRINKIEILGYKKVDYKALQGQLSGLIGKSLLFINSEEITSMVAFFIFFFLWPIKILIPNFFNRSVFLLWLKSLPCIMKPMLYIICANPPIQIICLQ